MFLFRKCSHAEMGSGGDEEAGSHGEAAESQD